MPSIMKEVMLREVRKGFEEKPYAFLSSFSGVNVADLSEFRRSVNKVAARSLVVKHAIAKKALREFKYDEAEKFLAGNVVVTFGDADPQIISKAISDFCKSNNKFVSGGMIFEKRVYDKQFVAQLAALPSRHELLTQVVVRIKSPITGFVMGLSGLMRGLVVALNEVKKKREAAPAAA